MTYEEGWYQRGRCASDDPETISYYDKIFFPIKGRPATRILETLCGQCPVRIMCANDAIVHDEEGIWGGLSKPRRDIIFNQIGERLVQDAIDEGWFNQERLSEYSPIHLIANRYRKQNEKASLPSQSVVVVEVTRRTFYFDFELLEQQGVQPKAEEALELMAESLEEAPHPTVLRELHEMGSRQFRFDFEDA